MLKSKQTVKNVKKSLPCPCLAFDLLRSFRSLEVTALVSGWLSISWTSGEGVDDLLAAAAEAKNWQTDNAADSNSSTLNKAFRGEG